MIGKNKLFTEYRNQLNLVYYGFAPAPHFKNCGNPCNSKSFSSQHCLPLIPARKVVCAVNSCAIDLSFLKIFIWVLLLMCFASFL